jgi:MOSC domain-containing protein YiiM
MDPAEEARAVRDRGLEGNADRGGWRQITVIEQEVFDRVRESLPDADPMMRRANFLVDGVRLADCRGKVLEVGDLRIHMRGETRPCELMDEQCDGLRSALDPDWNAGAFGKVLNDAVVRVGDEVRWGEMQGFEE